MSQVTNQYKEMLEDQIRKRNKKVFSRQQKVERDAEDTISSGKLSQTFGAAT